MEHPKETRSEGLPHHVVARGIPIRRWRVMYIEGGCLVFVDPKREHVRLWEGPDPNFPKRGQRVNDPVEAEVQMALWEGFEGGEADA